MSLRELLNAKKQSIAAGKKGKTVKPPAGRSLWRIYPSWRGAGQQFWHDFGQHFIKNSGEQLLAIYVDTEKTFGVPSEINAEIQKAIAGCTDDATMKLLKDAKASASVLLNAQQIDGTNPNEIVILEVRPTVFEQIVNIATEFEDAGKSIFDVAAGHELVIERTGTGLNTKYSVNVAAINRGKVPADWEKKLHNLDDYVKQESAEGAFKALNAVRLISGALPAPGAGPALGASGIPIAGRLPAAAASGAALPAEDIYATAPSPSATPKATPSVAAFEDVPDLTAAAPAPAPAPAPAAAPAAAAVESTGDPELDALLGTLQ